MLSVKNTGWSASATTNTSGSPMATSSGELTVTEPPYATSVVAVPAHAAPSNADSVRARALHMVSSAPLPSIRRATATIPDRSEPQAREHAGAVGRGRGRDHDARPGGARLRHHVEHDGTGDRGAADRVARGGDDVRALAAVLVVLVDLVVARARRRAALVARVREVVAVPREHAG